MIRFRISFFTMLFVTLQCFPKPKNTALIRAFGPSGKPEQPLFPTPISTFIQLNSLDIKTCTITSFGASLFFFLNSFQSVQTVPWLAIIMWKLLCPLHALTGTVALVLFLIIPHYKKKICHYPQTITRGRKTVVNFLEQRWITHGVCKVKISM